MEYLDYTGEAFYKAWSMSWSKLGIGINIISSAFAALMYSLFGWGALDIYRGLVILLFFSFLTFGIYTIWEMRAAFPVISVKKINHVAEARIIIENKELADLTDLSIELVEYKRVFLNEKEEEGTVSHEDRFFKIEGQRSISYDGGTKVVVIASGESGEAFLGNMLETDYEYHEGWHYLIYDIVIRIKGKIDGRIIYPKVVTGRLKYSKSHEKTYAYIQGEKVETSTSRFQWDS